MGEKPYACKHCNQFFSRSSSCKQHERTHTGEKPYACKHCDKCFSDPSACKQHEEMHTGEKPYKCKHWNKCFNKSSNCRRHEQNHTGEKPYACKHCNKGFSRSSDCKRHEEIHVRDSSLNHEQHDQRFELRHVLDPATSQGGKMFSLREENSSRVETLTSWIYEEELSNKTLSSAEAQGFFSGRDNLTEQCECRHWTA